MDFNKQFYANKNDNNWGDNDSDDSSLSNYDPTEKGKSFLSEEQKSKIQNSKAVNIPPRETSIIKQNALITEMPRDPVEKPIYSPDRFIKKEKKLYVEQVDSPKMFDTSGIMADTYSNRLDEATRKNLV